MVSNASDASITKTEILLGQSINLKVIAEGVENAAQFAMLQQFGCDEVQGCFFACLFLLWKNSCLRVNFLAEKLKPA
jgi:EAL domain-containing protein (putative c-di-GMP-specific phosphodiesterase class I)